MDVRPLFVCTTPCSLLAALEAVIGNAADVYLRCISKAAVVAVVTAVVMAVVVTAVTHIRKILTARSPLITPTTNIYFTTSCSPGNSLSRVEFVLKTSQCCQTTYLNYYKQSEFYKLALISFI